MTACSVCGNESRTCELTAYAGRCESCWEGDPYNTIGVSPAECYSGRPVGEGRQTTNQTSGYDPAAGAWAGRGRRVRKMS